MHGIAAPSQTPWNISTTHVSPLLLLNLCTTPTWSNRRSHSRVGVRTRQEQAPPLLRSHSTENQRNQDATHSFLLDVAFSARALGFPLTPAQSRPSSVPSESVLSLRTFLLGRSARLDISKGDCPAADAYLQLCVRMKLKCSLLNKVKW